jgi:hypothetical protein
MSIFKPPAASRRICDQKARNMWPEHAEYVFKSTEYVAKTRRICVQKAQNYVAEIFVAALCAAVK